MTNRERFYLPKGTRGSSAFIGHAYRSFGLGVTRRLFPLNIALDSYPFADLKSIGVAYRPRSHYFDYPSKNVFIADNRIGYALISLPKRLEAEGLYNIVIFSGEEVTLGCLELYILYN